MAKLDAAPTLLEIAALQGEALSLVDSADEPDNDPISAPWLTQLRQALIDSSRHARERINLLERIAAQCQDLADMDFSFLYDPSRDLFSIGYNVADRRLDGGSYDLLASEARLGSYVAIAEGQVGQEHWFALGRLLTSSGATPALLSWSGSMFEFLMPLLVMPTYQNTLLDQTYRAIVRRQIAYGKQRGVPWGSPSRVTIRPISTSTTSTARSACRGWASSAGWPTIWSSPPTRPRWLSWSRPRQLAAIFEQLAANGQQGDYGFYEAVDYTPARLLPGTTSVTVRQFMAHHQGMTLLSLAYLLLGKPMQRRFEADATLRRRRSPAPGARAQGKHGCLPPRL